MASVDTLLMGRNSYDTVLGFPEWFYGDKPVVVLTHRPAAPREHVSFQQGRWRRCWTSCGRRAAAIFIWMAARWSGRDCRPRWWTS